MTHVQLAAVALPDLGAAGSEPFIPIGLYAQRLSKLRDLMARDRYDFIIVYADREHSANISYLSGFDPRFEEALLIVAPGGDPAILVGNECGGIADAAPLPMRIIPFQDFSLPGQPRDSSSPLGEILSSEGLTARSRVGLVGWKTFADRSTVELPAYIVDEIRSACHLGAVENAGSLLINAVDGLRVINEIDQLAAFEWAACHTSTGVRGVLAGLQPGMTEREAAQLLGWSGEPLSCHLMLTAGPRARLGLLSPGDRPIERGDPFTIAYGIRGALNCRAGFVVHDASELPAGAHDYVDRLVVPYFTAVAEWYEALHVGQTGGTLQAIVDRHIGDPFFGVSLNPGHQIHLDEWVNSPVHRGSSIELRSGMALQCDIIPATGTPYFTTNIEDGVAIGDESLRAEFAAKYPDAWHRIGLRRRFMIDVLGIDLHLDVMPFSNLAAFLPPFLLDQGRAMVKGSG